MNFFHILQAWIFKIDEYLSSTLSQYSVLMVWIAYSNFWSFQISIIDLIYLQSPFQKPSLSKSVVKMDHHQKTICCYPFSLYSTLSNVSKDLEESIISTAAAVVKAAFVQNSPGFSVVHHLRLNGQSVKGQHHHQAISEIHGRSYTQLATLKQ